jgi:hypothetical protein
MMVQEGQWCVDRDGLKPKGKFRKFDRHGIDVDAEEAGLRNPAFPVEYPRLAVGCALRVRVSREGIGRDLLSEVLARTDQEVSGSHSRIQHGEREHAITETSG